MKILQDLYNSEINFSISCIWDGGFDVKLLGDEGNYLVDVSCETANEAIQFLKLQTLKYYPNSTFANKYKNRSIVEELKQKGYRVDITHSRYHPRHFNHTPYGNIPILMQTHRLRQLYGKLNEVNPHGGQTIVFITHLESGKTYNGQALCSLEDTFDRKFGIKIAIERALKGVDV